jgi:hypothetical protein
MLLSEESDTFTWKATETFAKAGVESPHGRDVFVRGSGMKVHASMLGAARGEGAGGATLPREAGLRTSIAARPATMNSKPTFWRRSQDRSGPSTDLLRPEILRINQIAVGSVCRRKKIPKIPRSRRRFAA